MEKQLTPPPQLGDILHAARKAQELTLEHVATRSGVSKSMLSQIERGAVNPTFAVVWNLTQTLGVDMASLTEAAENAQESLIDHDHSYATPTQKSADGLVLLRMLGPYRTVLPVEWYDMVLQPGGVLDSTPHAQGTYEHLTCLDGTIAVEVDGRRVVAATGDTLRYYADRPHRILNPSDHPARALLLVALPKQYDTPAR